MVLFSGTFSSFGWFNTGGQIWIGSWLFIKCNVPDFYMVTYLAHMSIKPKELKFLMNKMYSLLTFDLFSVYVALKFALVILDNFPSSCYRCENPCMQKKKKGKQAIWTCFVSELLSTAQALKGANTQWSNNYCVLNMNF